jgi:hypothetical protein
MRPGGTKEFTKDVFAKTGGQPHEPASARWQDGFETDLDDLTIVELGEMKDRIGVGRNKVKKEWEGTLPAGTKLYIAIKKDHKALLVLYENGKPLIYLPADEKPELALSILTTVAEDYIKGVHQKENLRDVKAEIWKKANNTVLKRPASSSTSAAAPENKPSTKEKASDRVGSGSGKVEEDSSPATPKAKANKNAKIETVVVATPPVDCFMDSVYE